MKTYVTWAAAAIFLAATAPYPRRQVFREDRQARQPWEARRHPRSAPAVHRPRLPGRDRRSQPAAPRPPSTAKPNRALM